MDALNMAAVNPPSTQRDFAKSAILEAENRLPPRVRAVLTLLLEAFEYAHDLEANVWDFATEISNLRRLKLSNSDLRWLVGRGLVGHGVEVTLGGDEERSFQHPSRVVFCKKTCFVLSPAGAALAHRLCEGNGSATLAEARPADEPPSLSIASPPGPQPPKWDRDRQELRVGSAVVKRFKIPSPHEETVLAAFEELNWPPRIDDPLPPCDEPSPKWRLQEAIELLNGNQRQHLVRFRTDSTGRGILWEFCNDHGASRDSW